MYSITNRLTMSQLVHGIRNTHHGQDGRGVGVIESDVLVVRETRTFVRILWQNGGISENVPAAQLIPYPNPDEYDCWPGDYVLWKGDDPGETRAAVVQHVMAGDRTAQVFWKSPPQNHPPNARFQPYSMVSVLELDPHGMSGPSPEQPDSVGVRRGEFVFIHREGTTNGSTLPVVPKIGEVEAWVREMDLDPAGHGGWREQMAIIGAEYHQRFEAIRYGTVQTHSGRLFAAEALDGEFEPRIGWANTSAINWFGEVVNVGFPSNVHGHQSSDIGPFYSSRHLVMSRFPCRLAPRVSFLYNGLHCSWTHGIQLAMDGSNRLVGSSATVWTSNNLFYLKILVCSAIYRLWPRRSSSTLALASLLMCMRTRTRKMVTKSWRSLKEMPGERMKEPGRTTTVARRMR